MQTCLLPNAAIVLCVWGLTVGCSPPPATTGVSPPPKTKATESSAHAQDKVAPKRQNDLGKLLADAERANHAKKKRVVDSPACLRWRRCKASASNAYGTTLEALRAAKGRAGACGQAPPGCATTNLTKLNLNPIKQKQKAPSLNLKSNNGAIADGELRRAMNRVRGQLDYCRTKHPAHSTGALRAGTIVMVQTIGRTGRSSSSKVTKDTLGPPSIANCVNRLLARMRYPKPKGGSDASVTWELGWR